MKNLKSFKRFSLNESYSPNLSRDNIEIILDAMEGNPKVAVGIYYSFRNKLPLLFKSLQEVAESKGKSLEDIIDSFFKKDPTLLYLLDDKPDLKKEVLDRIGIEDFSRLGRISKLKGLFDE